MYSDSESLAVLYVVLCIQTQKAWLYYMLCCIFGLRKPGCIIFCVMHSDSESLTVLHVVLCIQTQKICLYFYVVLCIRTQKAWPETLPDCLVVQCLRLRKPDQRHCLTAWLCYVSDPVVRQQRQVWCMWRPLVSTPATWQRGWWPLWQRHHHTHLHTWTGNIIITRTCIAGKVIQISQIITRLDR